MLMTLCLALMTNSPTDRRRPLWSTAVFFAQDEESHVVGKILAEIHEESNVVGRKSMYYRTTFLPRSYFHLD